MKKKIMLLGGNYFQMTATKASKELGYYTISVDYLPNNPAHRFADEYHNVNTTDKSKVLKLARSLKIDGIVSYASDVGAPTAAYVAEKMGLATNPYESVKLLTRKDLVRPFLKKHGFNVPRSQSFKSYEGIVDFFDEIRKPVMIKPVDASGSKGVFKVFEKENLKNAYDKALSFSNEKVVIVEEFLQREGYQIAGDGFIVDGKLVFAGLANEHFDRLCNPLVPIGESFPANLHDSLKDKSIKEIQRLLSLLKMKQGAINLDFMFDKNGELYILEIGPRNGGNLISDAIKYGSDVDLAKYTIKTALNEDCSDLMQKPFHTFTSSYVIHAICDGIYKGINFDPKIKNDILLFDMFVKPGDSIHKFVNGAMGIGAMLIRFDSMEQMLYSMDHMEEFVKVEVK